MRWKPEIDPSDIADDWAVRSEFWLSRATKSAPRRKLRQRNPAPLILNGHGVSLRIENGALVIRDGFTHYPQEQARYRFFPGSLDIPTRILLLDGSGTLSFDVLSWLAEQGVALARIKANGEIATVASGTGYAADREKVEWQQATRTDETKRLAFAADLIRRKIVSTIPTLEVHIPPSKAREMALEKADTGIARLSREAFTDIGAIFAIEGECAAAYFQSWQGLPVRWKGIDRHPVPQEWRAYNRRSSRATGVKAKNRNASHPVNAMLNYAYTVKLAQLQIAAIADGYDPTLGIMHNSNKGSPAWVLDMIELERAAVDAVILQFMRDQSFAPADFVIRKDGVCRLSPQLARALSGLVESFRSTAQASCR
ncbi:CRISPR-associated endonuclease Cas1 [Sphingomonas sp. CL5.1]|uniref:CRISPR-associated endonuclease Cas1 n=1 Tax=Sphingomonas sp. CL5.1 TaxID=2653203 RepID=UPI001582FD27|nr:CRISPR-associated endonuclease Cas1 [Sphingomonas sp. CL5.1]QKR98699.1 CRISPR-associated endonuclease Cas1 [Sphingomonas sp. CL5.1]